MGELACSWYIIHPLSNKFVTGVMIKATDEWKLDDSPTPQFCRYRNAAMFYDAIEGTYPYHTDPLDWLVSGLSLGYTACHNQVFVKFLRPFNCISEVIFWWVLYCTAVKKPQISCFWVIYINKRQKRQKKTKLCHMQLNYHDSTVHSYKLSW